MAVGWAKEGDGELEAENEIAAEIQRAREALEESQGAPRTECVDCGEPIGKARLKAMPKAQRCITCQSEYE